MSKLIDRGYLSVPSDWEAVQDIAFLEPRKAPAKSMTIAKVEPPPRANIRVQRRSVGPDAAAKAECEAFINRVREVMLGSLRAWAFTEEPSRSAG